MRKIYLLLTLALLSLFSVEIHGEGTNTDEVTLTIAADGATKQEAIKNALRNAVEQAYGAFVSANTTIVNDNLVKDEIATIASGNIKSYDEVSSYNAEGKTFVTLRATVCVNKLISYAKSKGASTEFAGQTFAMNMKLKELNRQNEFKVFYNNLINLLCTSLPNCYDLKVTIGEVKFSEERLWEKSNEYHNKCVRLSKLGETYDLPITVTFVPNSNAIELDSIFWYTLRNIALSDSERAEYKRLNMPCGKEGFWYDLEHKIYLRNGGEIEVNSIRLLAEIAMLELFNFVIKDNLGQENYFTFHSEYTDYSSLRDGFSIDGRYHIYATGNAILSDENDIDDILYYVWDYAKDWCNSCRDHLTDKRWINPSTWVHVGFNKEKTLEVILKIPQADISKYTRFYIEKRTDDLRSISNIWTK